jgi:FKBP-type peptidyl-prolyl cis-trans isomerase
MCGSRDKGARRRPIPAVDRAERRKNAKKAAQPVPLGLHRRLHRGYARASGPGKGHRGASRRHPLFTERIIIMKKRSILALAAVASLAALAFSCGTAAAATTEGAPVEPSRTDASYAMGIVLGQRLKQTGYAVDFNEFLKGVKDSYSPKDDALRLKPEDIDKLLQEAFEWAAWDVGQKGQKFLEENAKKNGIKATASGLQYEVITEAEGPKPVATDIVKVHYEGRLIDGSKFDSSYDRGEPITFPLGQVIPGWTEGVQLMSVGSTYKFYIPSELAYGPQGSQTIPANSVLVFTVELISIEPPAPDAGMDPGAIDLEQLLQGAAEGGTEGNP